LKEVQHVKVGLKQIRAACTCGSCSFFILLSFVFVVMKLCFCSFPTDFFMFSAPRTYVSAPETCVSGAETHVSAPGNINFATV
jgi:hypothetical protein